MSMTRLMPPLYRVLEYMLEVISFDSIFSDHRITLVLLIIEFDEKES